MTIITQGDLDVLLYGKQTPTPTPKLKDTSASKPRGSNVRSLSFNRRDLPSNQRRDNAEGIGRGDEETLQLSLEDNEAECWKCLARFSIDRMVCPDCGTPSEFD